MLLLTAVSMLVLVVVIVAAAAEASRLRVFFGVMPLVRRESGHYPHGQRDENVGQQQEQPNLHRQRIHERKETRRRRLRYLILLLLPFVYTSCTLRPFRLSSSQQQSKLLMHLSFNLNLNLNHFSKNVNFLLRGGSFKNDDSFLDLNSTTR